MSVQLVPGGVHDQFEHLRTRSIELGFAGTTAPISQPDIEAEVLFEEPLVVVAGVDNPWARHRRIELADLVNEPWTWSPPGSLIDSLVVEAFRANQVEPPRAMLYADPYSMRIWLAATGRFLAIVPSSIMRFPGRPLSIKALPIELPTTRRRIGIITLRNRALSPLVWMAFRIRAKLAA